MKEEAELNAESDRKMKEEVDKINSADGLIFQTEKQLKEFGDKLPAEKKAPIEKALAELKEAHQSRNLQAIDTSMAALNAAWQAASEEMYKASQQAGDPSNQQQQQQSQGNDGGKAPDQEVTDVDFEEVK